VPASGVTAMNNDNPKITARGLLELALGATPAAVPVNWERVCGESIRSADRST